MCNVEYPPTHLHFGYRCQHKQLSATRASLRLTSWKLVRLSRLLIEENISKLCEYLIDSCNEQYHVSIVSSYDKLQFYMVRALCARESDSMNPSDLIGRDLRLLQITRSTFKPRKTHVTKFLDSLCKQSCPEVSFNVVRVKKGNLPDKKQWKVHFV